MEFCYHLLSIHCTLLDLAVEQGSGVLTRESLTCTTYCLLIKNSHIALSMAVNNGFTRE